MHPAINLNIQKQNNPMRTVKFVIEISNRPISFIYQQVSQDGAYLMDRSRVKRDDDGYRDGDGW